MKREGGREEREEREGERSQIKQLWRVQTDFVYGQLVCLIWVTQLWYSVIIISATTASTLTTTTISATTVSTISNFILKMTHKATTIILLLKLIRILKLE